jgi:hypothetical protein
VGEYVVYGAVYAVTAGVIAVGGTSEERAAVWSEWTSSADPEAPHEEQVWLIPRWATLEPKSGGYDAVVNIQACCIDFLLLHSASRTQRALVGIARRECRQWSL